MKLLRILFVVIPLLCFSCRNEKRNLSKERTVEHEEIEFAEWIKSANIYEVNLRQYTSEGTIRAFMRELPRLKSMNVDILQFMPLHPISKKKRKASSNQFVSDLDLRTDVKNYKGSPYAVADYLTINPDFGTIDDFKDLVRLIHDLDMKIIIEWVPNHTGWDHLWISEHSDWYKKSQDGEILSPKLEQVGNSGDLADLNYDNIVLQDTMISRMKYWLQDLKIDGFRMDEAAAVPTEFWKKCNTLLKADFPNIFLLADSNLEEHKEYAGFHAIFGSNLYHLINGIAAGNKTKKDLIDWKLNGSGNSQKGFYVTYISNHEENAFTGPAIERLGDAYPALAVLAITFDGMPLLYSGMEEPLRSKLSYYTKEAIPFKNYEYAKFYKRLFDFKHKNKAIWNGSSGAQIKIIGESKNVIGFTRTSGKNSVLVMINLSDQADQIKITETLGSFTDFYGGQQKRFVQNEELILEPWQYLIFNKL